MEFTAKLKILQKILNVTISIQDFALQNTTMAAEPKYAQKRKDT